MSQSEKEGMVTTKDLPSLSASMHPPSGFYQSGPEKQRTKLKWNEYDLRVSLDERDVEVLMVLRRPTGGFSVHRATVKNPTDRKLRDAANKVRRALLEEMKMYGP